MTIALIICYLIYVCICDLQPFATFDYQIAGYNQMEQDIDVYFFDGFRVESKLASNLKGQGKQVICFFSAGTIETFSPDYDKFSSVKGKQVKGTDDIYWIDTSNFTLLQPYFQDRVKKAKDSGCTAIEFSNTNAYTQDTGFDLSVTNAFLYTKNLYDLAKKEGLLVGLTNNPSFGDSFGNSFDFRVSSTCTFDSSCNSYLNYTQTGKPVFGLEYADSTSNASDIVSKCNAMFKGNMSGIVRDYKLDYDGFYFPCPRRIMSDDEDIPGIGKLSSIGKNVYV